MHDLKKLRAEIDIVDSKMLALIEKRAKIAKKIGDLKRKGGVEIRDPSREQEILSDVTSKTSLDQKFVKKIFQSIIDYCRKNE